jgi:TonB family protein
MGKLLSCLLLLSIVISQDNSQLPKQVVPFELYAYELPFIHDVVGKVLVSFTIDEEGNVDQAEIIDSFNVNLNDVVLDKVRQTKYQPAIQNGRAVKVKYQLPIVFK